MFGKKKSKTLVITGTNAKSSVARIITFLLEHQGLVVNTIENKQRKADIDVLTLSPEKITEFLGKNNTIDFLVVTNIAWTNDNHYLTLDETADQISQLVKVTKDTVILYRDDERIYRLGESKDKKANVLYFGIDDKLRKNFLNDDEYFTDRKLDEFDTEPVLDTWVKKISYIPNNEVVLMDFSMMSLGGEYGQGSCTAVYSVNGFKQWINLSSDKLEYAFNIAPAIAVVRAVLKNDLQGQELSLSVTQYRPQLDLDEVFEISNSTSLRVALNGQKNIPTMFVVQDSDDLKYFWTTNFKKKIDIITGNQAYDLAVRLFYSFSPYGKIEPDIDLALEMFNKLSNREKQIFATPKGIDELNKRGKNG
ncbi:MAG: hypothetical protein LBM13_02410 [Candidatus Ancillula sp.]|jgi:hypothetical protein|nr:hypothetical protein [Candidatus Ancillula sp.]